MEIKDYIIKNLTNLNWNILPQIFEENNVELTEEIEAYLRNTPENTNWNVVNSIGSGATKIKTIILQIGSGIVVSSDFNSAQEIYEYCENHNHIEYNEYDESPFVADGIEIYTSSGVDSEQPTLIGPLSKYTDTPEQWTIWYQGNGWSAIWGVTKINNTYDYLFNIIE